ncbi:hypothetical protein P12x_001958 [Tundrisphaera lichenicola]|uniref:hypothetical protein n=1 Tax=Tundrisphaera lichenicola TaxID=2029860 RepID=UPI003EC032DD
MMTLIWTFLISYLILFVVCYVVVEFGQNFFYDEVTPSSGLKVTLGAFLLAVMLTWTRSNFATMFTSEIGPTALQAILWSGVFILIFRFHPWHGFALAIATMILFTGITTIAVDSLLAPKTADRIDTTETIKPIRRPAYGAPKPANPPPAAK